MKYSISVVAPAYNEARDLRKLIEGWAGFLSSLEILSNFEICICNDGSTDHTAEVLRTAQEVLSCLKFVSLEHNMGASFALREAIKLADMEFVLLIDSDGQYPIENLRSLLSSITGNAAGAVIGERLQKNDRAFYRFGSKISSAVCNWIYGSSFRDFNCALKLIKTDIAKSLPIEARGLNYSADVLAKLLDAGVVVCSVPVSHVNRIGGVSSAKALRDARNRVLFVFYLWLKLKLRELRVLI